MNQNLLCHTIFCILVASFSTISPVAWYEIVKMIKKNTKSTYRAEFFIGNFTIAILISVNYRLVYNLLKLRIFLWFLLLSFIAPHTATLDPKPQYRKFWTNKNLPFKLFPTIIFNTWNNSPLEINPSLSMS